MYINRVKLEKKMKMKQIKPKTNRKTTRSFGQLSNSMGKY